MPSIRRANTGTLKIWYINSYRFDMYFTSSDYETGELTKEMIQAAICAIPDYPPSTKSTPRILAAVARMDKDEMMRLANTLSDTDRCIIRRGSGCVIVDTFKVFKENRNVSY